MLDCSGCRELQLRERPQPRTAAEEAGWVGALNADILLFKLLGIKLCSSKSSPPHTLQQRSLGRHLMCPASQTLVSDVHPARRHSLQPGTLHHSFTVTVGDNSKFAAFKII